MNFLDSLSISATGLNAQRIRMNLISSNMANVNTTRTDSGEPYIRKDVVFKAVQTKPFEEILQEKVSTPSGGVQIAEIIEDKNPFMQKYDPQHPDADENGYVYLPNINIVEEMVNMISASRSFEANATAVKTTKEMARTALEIGKN